MREDNFIKKFGDDVEILTLKHVVKILNQYPVGMVQRVLKDRIKELRSKK